MTSPNDQHRGEMPSNLQINILLAKVGGEDADVRGKLWSKRGAKELQCERSELTSRPSLDRRITSQQHLELFWSEINITIDNVKH